jgi:hypothetical protein
MGKRGNFAILDYLNVERIDCIGGLFPKRNNLLVPQPGLWLEDIAKFLKGCCWSERPFGPRVDQARNAYMAEGSAVG